MRLEHYIPKLANRDEQDKWLKSDAPDLRKNATRQVKEILSEQGNRFVQEDTLKRLLSGYEELIIPEEEYT
jgi:trimethylamine:corrinoid methyltransferase-like protein